MSLTSKLVAEFIGTFCLVFIGCGSVIFTALHVVTAGYDNAHVNVGIAWLGVGLTFGLVVMCFAYAIGHISGCHLNPAVSIGLWAAKRFPLVELPAYIITQIVGAAAGAVTLYAIAKGQSGFAVGNFACNGYEVMTQGSPLGFAWWACFLAEMIFTGIFLLVIIGSTDPRAPKGFAPIAIGLCLTMIHMALIPITNCSVNPARSTATAIIVAGFSKLSNHNWALGQLWLFWLAPILGAIVAGFLYRFLLSEEAGQYMAAASTPKRKQEEHHYSSAEPETFALDDDSPKPPAPKPH